jgi:GT2 family glycosyltransferase
VPNPVGLEDLLFQQIFDPGRVERCLPWHCTITQCLSVKRAHFHEIGAFASDLPRGQDVEFGYRAMLKGFEVRYCPQAIGRHNHALAIRQRCESERKNHRHLVTLFKKHPYLHREVRYLRYKWPPDWRRDSVSLVARKLMRRAMALRPLLGALELAWGAFRRVPLPLPVQRTLYWRIVGSYQLLGLRDGIRMYGPITPDSGEGGHV